MAYTKRMWLEEELGDDHKVAYRVNQVLYSGTSQYQDIDLVDTPTWGTVLLLDGKMQSTEADELLYHELLVHPALLHHPNPRTVFIMGGGEGATAREVLRHRSVEHVVMVDIDKVVTDFCAKHLHRNKATFEDPRLTLINDDARAQLEAWPGQFDVIIGDLADPLDGGPCYQLYTQEFYANVVLPKLAPGGLFVTQSGPASCLSCREVFTTIHHTLASVFPRTLPYAQFIPSFFDAWAFTLAFADGSARSLPPAEFNRAVKLRITGDLEHLDGEAFTGMSLMTKAVRKALAEETAIYTADTARFIHGSGALGHHGPAAAGKKLGEALGEPSVVSTEALGEASVVSTEDLKEGLSHGVLSSDEECSGGSSSSGGGGGAAHLRSEPLIAAMYCETCGAPCSRCQPQKLLQNGNANGVANGML